MLGKRSKKAGFSEASRLKPSPSSLLSKPTNTHSCQPHLPWPAHAHLGPDLILSSKKLVSNRNPRAMGRTGS